MSLTKDFLDIVLFGGACVLAAALGALVTRGWRSIILWLIALVALWLTWTWTHGPLTPLLVALWRSNALVVFYPVLLVALIRKPAPPRPPKPSKFVTGLDRPKPRFRRLRNWGAAAEDQVSATAQSPK